MKKLLTFLGVMLLSGQNVSANSFVVSLPPELAMQSDYEYGYDEDYEDYAPLPPLKGSYISGHRSGHPDYSDELVRKAPGKRCKSTYKIASQLPENEDDYVLYNWPAVHFWFFRHGNQALYIELGQVAFKEADCVLELKPKLTITRGIFLDDRLTTFRSDVEGKLSFETTLIDEDYHTEIPLDMMLDKLSGIKKRGGVGHRQIFREPRGKHSLKGVEEECYVFSNGLDGGSHCYISSRGPLYGHKSYSSFGYHIVGEKWYDDSFSYWELREAKPRAKIDSRLFEWDRKIDVARDPENEEHPEARRYLEDTDADAMVDIALARAAASGKHVIIVMGANWCHDSRALAGWFGTPRFSSMFWFKYEVVYIDVGKPQSGNGRNQHIIERFGGEAQTNTPYVMVLSPKGKLLNRDDAKSWRNAASRSEDEIFNYFAGFTERQAAAK